jgi:hypothetical protein
MILGMRCTKEGDFCMAVAEMARRAKTSGNPHFLVNVTDFDFYGFKISIWVPLSPIGPQKLS